MANPNKLVMLNAEIPPAYRKQLRLIAVLENKEMRELILEGLEMVFVKHGYSIPTDSEEFSIAKAS